MEDVMKDLWSSRWLWLFLPAIVSTLGPMVVVATVKEHLRAFTERWAASAEGIKNGGLTP
jgi:hypothetical protein